jgi:hypothetical protein
MLPRLTANNAKDSCRLDAKLTGKSRLPLTLLEALKYLYNFGIVEDSHAIGKGDFGALNMCPRFTSANLTNGLSEKIELFRDFLVRQSLIAKGKNFNNKFICQSGIPVRSAVWGVSRASTIMAFSSFMVHVSNIVGLCAKKEMIGIHARRIVISTWAVVANFYPFWNGAAVKFPTKAMNQDGAALIVHLTMTKRHFVASPKPTSSGFVDLTPKTLADRFSFSILRVHMFSPIEKPFAGRNRCVVSSKRTPRQRADESIPYMPPMTKLCAC